jgi:hypothetical protein
MSDHPAEESARPAAPEEARQVGVDPTEARQVACHRNTCTNDLGQRGPSPRGQGAWNSVGEAARRVEGLRIGSGDPGLTPGAQLGRLCGARRAFPDRLSDRGGPAIRRAGISWCPLIRGRGRTAPESSGPLAWRRGCRTGGEEFPIPPGTLAVRCHESHSYSLWGEERQAGIRILSRLPTASAVHGDFKAEPGNLGRCCNSARGRLARSRRQQRSAMARFPRLRASSGCARRSRSDGGLVTRVRASSRRWTGGLHPVDKHDR